MTRHLIRRLLPLAAVVVLAVGFAPTGGTTTSGGASPDGTLDTNPIGTLAWAPNNANEQPSGANVHRLTVEYDHSYLAPTAGEEPGATTELLAKGAFGVRLFTSTLANTNREAYPVKVVGHSPHVSSIDDEYGAPGEADAAFAGFSGDVRDGDCANLGTEEFSAAFSTTETVTTPSATPETTPCQILDATVDNGDGTFTHTITTYTPGFWVDVVFPNESDPLSGSQARSSAEIWYGTVYDTDGEDGDWYTTVDSTAQSQSVHAPGRYIANEDLMAPLPSPQNNSCVGQLAGDPTPGDMSEDEFTVDIPDGLKKVVVKLHPNGGDWDLAVIAPSGSATTSGNAPPFAEVVTLNSPPAGTYTVVGCNFAGPASVDVTVAVEY